MPRFGKNVLSQFLRTKCDKQLRLSIYAPPELAAMGWPVPLTARPAVQILRDAGVEWEQAKMGDLEAAFGANVRFDKRNGKYRDVPLQTILQQNLSSPTIILQPSFEHATLKDTFLQTLGLDAGLIAQMPPFGSFRPDIISVHTRLDDEIEVLPNGETRTIQPTDQRKALVICDIKHAGEANSSYSAEVALYAVLLSNWLRLVNLHGAYLVASRIALWTRAKEVSSLAELLTANPGAPVSARIEAFTKDLEPVDFPIFFQTIDHFFKTDLPRVLAVPQYQQLDWHVDARCSACDYLGYRNWLSNADRTILDGHRDHYCVPRAEDMQHLSRLATITRGGRKTLESAGHPDVPAVSGLQPAAPAFEQHNSLKADRNHLPHRATALVARTVTIAPNTTTIDFPSWADLETFITVNFDPGTGYLTAIGSEARFRQRVPFGQQSQVQRTWSAEAQTLLSATLAEERNVVVSFLSRLAEVFSFAYDTDPQKGGPSAARTRTQLYFWDRRQFEELAKAIGRHLNVIVMPPNAAILRGLVWLFPPEQTLQDDEVTLANPITFLKPVIQRDLRLPVSHCLTLFNVAEAYHNPQFPPRVPGSFYRDPFSDMIPRERIYEIWSAEPLVRVGNTQKTRSQCISAYSDTVKQQVAALRSAVWKFRDDMAGRLNFAARPLDIGVPFNFQGMSEDGRLWYGWARLEEAYKTIDLRRTWSEEPEQLEACYDILRFEQLTAQNNNELTYQVRASSRDCKFSDGQDFLALQDESVAGFLDLRFRDVAPNIQVPHQDRNRRLADIFQASLIEYDRDTLTARVRLTDFGSAPGLRQQLLANNLVNIQTAASLVAGAGPSMADRVRACLLAIGRPPIAAAAPATYQALGHAPGVNPPANDAITTASRVLWDAAALAVEPTTSSTAQIATSLTAVMNVNWPCNPSQQAAIQHCLTKRLSIVWGPPGTGKTTTAAALLAARILIAQAAQQPLRLLVTGPTYTAWEKLFADTLTLLAQLNVTNVTCFRVYSASHQHHAPLPQGVLPVTDVPASANDADFQTLIQHLDAPQGVVLVGAVAHQCYRIADQAHGSSLYEAFDFAAVDESSQLDLGKALFPLCLLTDAAEVVFLGDHLQMPPIVLTQPPSGAEWLVGSIQTYLIHRHNCPRQPLLTNYRSAQPFIEFGKRIGYPTGLSAHSPDLALHFPNLPQVQPPAWNAAALWCPSLPAIADPNRRLVAITYADGKSGQANEFEADLVCAIVQQLFLTLSASLANELDVTGTPIPIQAAPHTPETFWDRGVGIVTPHRAQRALIVRRLRHLFPTHPADFIDAAVDTVERFQGGQRDTIVISFGVGDPDLIADEESFLLQLERTNVAISRARAKCILAISDDLIYHLPSDRDTILTSKAVKSYVSDVCRQTQPVTVPDLAGAQRPIVLRWNS
ncbi:MAG: DEAD/DEAH box helicase [Phycisphaerae bacterium]|nr:DEAD/DEAH box helicase [Phycisphaerae bacterium]